MQHDLFHVYTVDQHILMVVRNLRRFTMPEFAHEFPLCTELMSGFERRWLLYVAALYHDIAKGRGGDHSHLGSADARSFARRHGLAKDDRELVEFLVENHLAMSHVAQKQDVYDPEVIAAFAKRVKTERRLIALYLLTVADMRGTRRPSRICGYGSTTWPAGARIAWCSTFRPRSRSSSATSTRPSGAAARR